MEQHVVFPLHRAPWSWVLGLYPELRLLSPVHVGFLLVLWFFWLSLNMSADILPTVPCPYTLFVWICVCMSLIGVYSRFMSSIPGTHWAWPGYSIYWKLFHSFLCKCLRMAVAECSVIKAEKGDLSNTKISGILIELVVSNIICHENCCMTFGLQCTNLTLRKSSTGNI